jgi:hypothetical protein
MKNFCLFLLVAISHNLFAMEEDQPDQDNNIICCEFDEDSEEVECCPKDAQDAKECVVTSPNFMSELVLVPAHALYDTACDMFKFACEHPKVALVYGACWASQAAGVAAVAVQNNCTCNACFKCSCYGWRPGNAGTSLIGTVPSVPECVQVCNTTGIKFAKCI